MTFIMAINVGNEPTREEMNTTQLTVALVCTGDLSMKPRNAQELVSPAGSGSQTSGTDGENCDGTSQCFSSLLDKCVRFDQKVNIPRKKQESFFQRLRRLNKAAKMGISMQYASRKNADMLTGKDNSQAPELKMKRNNYYQEVSSPMYATDTCIDMDGSSDEDISVFDKHPSSDCDANISRRGSSLARLRRLGSSIIHVLGRCLSGSTASDSRRKTEGHMFGSEPRLVFNSVFSSDSGEETIGNTDLSEDILSMVHRPFENYRMARDSSNTDEHIL